MSEHVQAIRHRYATAILRGEYALAESLAQQIGVSPIEVIQHLRAVQHWPDEDPPAPFDVFSAIGPGCFDPRVFDQTTWWVDILRRPHLIVDQQDFPDAHLEAVVKMLLARALVWARFEEMDIAADGVFSPAWIQQEAERWMERTTLMVALRAEAVRRGLSW